MKRSSSRLLRRTLRANAIFSLTCAALFLLEGRTVAAFVGIATTAGVFGTGLLLAAFGAGVLRLARRPDVSVSGAAAAVVLDALWVAGSLAVLWIPVSALTNRGRLAVAGIAAVVLALGALGALGLGRSRD